MTVHFVGVGPGSLELLTIKAFKLITEAKICVFAGSLINDDILELLPIDCECHNSAHMHLNQITDVYIAAQKKELDVVRLHSGDTSLYSTINEQIYQLKKHNISYDVTPGVSAFQAGAAAICAELTVPELNQTIILSRVNGETVVPKYQELDKLASIQATLCLYLSVKYIANITKQLIPYYGKDCPIAIVEKASWPSQRIITGNLENINEKLNYIEIERTAIIIIGHVLKNNNVTFSKLYDTNYSHMFRKK